MLFDAWLVWKSNITSRVGMGVRQRIEFMSEAKKDLTDNAADKEDAGVRQPEAAAGSGSLRTDGRRWWLRIFFQPVLVLVAGILVIVLLGTAQRLGLITSDGGNPSGEGQASAENENARYICPMMCTPPQAEPGRCPVCLMELVAATSGASATDGLSIHIDAVARRVANIRTVAVKAVPLTRRIRAVGELSYDEGTLKTIAAYVDGRLERLYADYTGAVVEKGDHLALVYSPRLYSSQVELLVARRAREQRRLTTPGTTAYSSRDLYGSARERLLEFGMTPAQIEALEQAGEANSRLHLCAPISGTVIKKLAVEGQYVTTGQAIYRLADLSSVWLMLELFPEDAAAIRYGHVVEAEVQSIPGRNFTGRVAFVAPTVNPRTRTVGVRVVMANDEGLLRIGDYAKATVAVRVSGSGEPPAQVYDPDLAGKWISPRHPHVIESAPGTCRECGVDLVPATRFGYASQPVESSPALVVPRSAVLMAGQSSVVYVETEPGRFEMRRVVLGPGNGDEIAILEGVADGEQVAFAGNFLIDSQMQLAGLPSLIDPTRAPLMNAPDEARSDELLAAMAQLSGEDRALAERQKICPVTEMLLGSMGTPIKVDVEGTPVFICCEGCRKGLLAEPTKHLAKLAADRMEEESAGDFPSMDLPPIGPMTMMDDDDIASAEVSAEAPDESGAIAVALEKLPPAERVLARRQLICPVTEMRLGSMGAPIKVDVDGRSIWICCEGCRESLLANPAKYLAKLPQEVAR